MQAWANCEDFVLVAAMNPCPYSHFNDLEKKYTCFLGLVSDLANEESIHPLDLAEAVQCRLRGIV